MDNYRGATIGIDIIGINDGMPEVFKKLDEHKIDYSREDSSDHQVYVSPSYLGEAVRIINEMGYETDEDNVDDDDNLFTFKQAARWGGHDIKDIQQAVQEGVFPIVTNKKIDITDKNFVNWSREKSRIARGYPTNVKDQKMTYDDHLAVTQKILEWFKKEGTESFSIYSPGGWHVYTYETYTGEPFTLYWHKFPSHQESNRHSILYHFRDAYPQITEIDADHIIDNYYGLYRKIENVIKERSSTKDNENGQENIVER